VGKVRRVLEALVREPRAFGRRHRWELLLATIGALLLVSVFFVDVPHAGDAGGVLVGAGLASILYTEDEHHRRGPLRRASAERIGELARALLASDLPITQPVAPADFGRIPSLEALEARAQAEGEKPLVAALDASYFVTRSDELRTWWSSRVGTHAAALSIEANTHIHALDVAFDDLVEHVRALSAHGDRVVAAYLSGDTAAGARDRALAGVAWKPVAAALTAVVREARWLAKMTADDEARRP